MPGNWRRLQVFVQNFKSDFDLIQVQSRTRTEEVTFSYGALNDTRGGSSRIRDLESTNDESSLQVITASGISEPVNVDSSQPTIAHAPESPASHCSSTVISHEDVPVPSGDAVDSLPETAELEGATLAVSCPTPISHEVIFVPSSDPVGTGTAGGATLAVPYPTPPQTDNGKPDESEAEEESGSEETDELEGRVTNVRPRYKTYHFHNCRTVYMNAFNSRGIKVRNSGNHAPQVTYNDASPSFFAKMSESSSHADLGEGESSQYPPDSPQCNCHLRLPPVIPPLPFQESGDISLAGQSAQPISPFGTPEPARDPRVNQFTVAPPFLGFEEGQTSMYPMNIESVTIEATSSRMPRHDNTFSGQHSPKMPESKILPVPRTDLELPPLTTNGFAMPMGLLPPFPAAQNTFANNDPSGVSSSPSDIIGASLSRDSPDTNSMVLEHQLQSVLETVMAIQKRHQIPGISSSEEIITLRAQGTLRAIIALVQAMETPIPSPRTAFTGTWRSRQRSSGCESLYHSHS